MRKINLDILKKGLPGISPSRGRFYREAAIVGLKQQGFESGVVLKIEGAFEEDCVIEWKDDIKQFVVNSWNDEFQVVNFGAVGIALLLVMELMGFRSFEEATIGTGIDFWISKELLKKKTISYTTRVARLEISGIKSEKPGNTINMRVGKKKKQINQSEDSELPGWIVIVEFGTPKSKIIKK